MKERKDYVRKKGFFTKAFENMKESTKKQHEIDKDNIAKIKKDNKEMREALKNYKSDDLKEFNEAKGIKEKAKVVMSHVERDSKKITEENQENYKKMLEEQRQNI